MRLWRAHGLGNDYLVLEDGPALEARLVVAICDRHRGVGGDGVLEPRLANDADFGVRIWNPDGSVAEKSGNGLRIFARWLVGERGAAPEHSVSTGACVVRCAVRGDDVTVEMGQAAFGAVEALIDCVLGQVVDVGNPRCAVSTDDLDGPWRRRGAAIEVDPRFPNRTNVQFARALDRATVEARIWERGAGETLASGSSSCAIAAAAVRSGRADPGTITVVMPGGSLRVTVSPTFELVLDGPVEPVGHVDVDPTWLTRHG